MRRLIPGLLVVGLISTTPRDAAAQTGPSINDTYAYAALTGTPIGALSPIFVTTGTKGEKSFDTFAGRFSHYSPKAVPGVSQPGDNSLAASFYHKLGLNAVVSGTAGYTVVGCPAGATCNNAFMLGGDVHSALWNSPEKKGENTAMSVNLQGSVGYGHSKDVNALSLAVGAPLAITMEQADHARIAAFITPGFGFGSLSAKSGTTTTSKSGMLPLVGVGAAWMAAEGWGIHASYNKVFVKDISGNNFGLGFTYNMK